MRSQEQAGSAGGNDVPALLPVQQLPVPVPAHARSTAKDGGFSRGSGFVPLPCTWWKRTWVSSEFGSIPSAAHVIGSIPCATQKLATAMPKVLFPRTTFSSTRFWYAASTRMPVPTKTPQTSSLGLRHVFGLLLFSTTLLWTWLCTFCGTSRNGSVKERMQPVLPTATLSSRRTFEEFSISNPLTFPVARLWSTRTSCDCPTYMPVSFAPVATLSVTRPLPQWDGKMPYSALSCV